MGIVERYPTLAFSRASIDPGDLPQDPAVPEHHPQVSAHLRSDAVEPALKVPSDREGSIRFAGRLSGWLKTEANKPRKQKRTVLQLHADLVSLGYGGSYNGVAAFAREWTSFRYQVGVSNQTLPECADDYRAQLHHLWRHNLIIPCHRCGEGSARGNWSMVKKHTGDGKCATTLSTRRLRL